MKTKTFVLAFIIGLFAVAVWADAGFIGEPSTSGVPVSGGGGDFCSGTELFCADFETDGMITWDSTPGDEDCDGYDTGGDGNPDSDADADRNRAGSDDDHDLSCSC